MLGPFYHVHLFSSTCRQHDVSLVVVHCATETWFCGLTFTSCTPVQCWDQCWTQPSKADKEKFRYCCRGGRGRHAFMFMRHTNMFGWLGMLVFNAVPFIYELRALLDWSCTPTTLTLFDWLKLEVSLLSCTCWLRV